MSPKEAYREMINDRLDKIEEAEFVSSLKDGRYVDLFLSFVAGTNELVARFKLAQQAFPGMTWEEFTALTKRRLQGSRKRGRPKVDLLDQARTPLSLAARDVDRVNAIWRELKPAGSRAKPPVSSIEIVAERRSVDLVELGERVRRPNSRRPDRLISRP